MNPFAYFFLGCLVTVICAAVPFIVSSRQLSKEAKQLRKLIGFIVRGLEEAGLATYRRDATGDIIGMVFSESITEGVRFSSKTDEAKKP